MIKDKQKGAGPGRWATTKQACELATISRPTLYQWARLYRIRRYKIGRVVRWDRGDLERVIEGRVKVLR